MKYSNIITKAIVAGLLLFDAQAYASDAGSPIGSAGRRQLGGRRRLAQGCVKPPTVAATVTGGVATMSVSREDAGVDGDTTNTLDGAALFENTGGADPLPDTCTVIYSLAGKGGNTVPSSWLSVDASTGKVTVNVGANPDYTQTSSGKIELVITGEQQDNADPSLNNAATDARVELVIQFATCDGLDLTTPGASKEQEVTFTAGTFPNAYKDAVSNPYRIKQYSSWEKCHSLDADSKSIYDSTQCTNPDESCGYYLDGGTKSELGETDLVKIQSGGAGCIRTQFCGKVGSIWSQPPQGGVDNQVVTNLGITYTCTSPRSANVGTKDESNAFETKKLFNLYKKCPSIEYSIVNTDLSTNSIPGYLKIDKATGIVTIDTSQNPSYTAMDNDQFSVSAKDPSQPAVTLKLKITQAVCDASNDLEAYSQAELDAKLAPFTDTANLIYFSEKDESDSPAVLTLRYMQQYIKNYNPTKCPLKLVVTVNGGGAGQQVVGYGNEKDVVTLETANLVFGSPRLASYRFKVTVTVQGLDTNKVEKDFIVYKRCTEEDTIEKKEEITNNGKINLKGFNNGKYYNIALRYEIAKYFKITNGKPEDKCPFDYEILLDNGNALNTYEDLDKMLIADVNNGHIVLDNELYTSIFIDEDSDIFIGNDKTFQLRIWTNYHLEYNSASAAAPASPSDPDLRQYMHTRLDVIAGCDKQAIDWSLEFRNQLPITIKAYRQIYGKVRFPTRVGELYTDGLVSNCGVTWILQKGLQGNPSTLDYITKDIPIVEDLVNDGLYIDKDKPDPSKLIEYNYIEFDQSNYPGNDIENLYIRIFTDEETLEKRVRIQDRCPTQTVRLNDSSLIDFLAVKRGYNIPKSNQTVSEIFANNDPTDCPIIDYRIHQLYNNGQREWASVRDIIYVDKQGYIRIDEEKYRGETINAKIQAWTNFRQPIERDIRLTENIIKTPICIEQTVSVINQTDFVMNATIANLTAEEPLDTQKWKKSNDSVFTMFNNTDEFNCPIQYYLLNEWGKDLTYLQESGQSMIRMDKEGFINVDEVRYNNVTFVFQVMALTRYNEPKFKTIRIEADTPYEDDDYEVAVVLSIVGFFLLVACCGFVANRWMKNAPEARKNNMMRRMRVSSSDMMDTPNGMMEGGEMSEMN